MSSLDVMALFKGLPVVRATLNHKELRAKDTREAGQSLHRDSLIIIVSDNNTNIYVDFTFTGKVSLNKAVISLLDSENPDATLADIDLRCIFKRLAGNERHLEDAFARLVANNDTPSRIQLHLTPYSTPIKKKSPLRLLR